MNANLGSIAAKAVGVRAQDFRRCCAETQDGQAREHAWTAGDSLPVALVKLCTLMVTSAGVQVFISDIRNCSNKEQEQLRVDKELGKIRKKFASGNVLSGTRHH